MATEGLEVIDGNNYWVTRDDLGAIISQEGRGPVIPPAPFLGSDYSVVKPLLRKSAGALTLKDQNDLLRFVVDRTLTTGESGDLAT